MSFRALVAFVVGKSLFADAPYFDSEIPGQGKGKLVLGAGLGVAVGSSPLPGRRGMGSALSSGTHQTRMLLSVSRA